MKHLFICLDLAFIMFNPVSASSAVDISPIVERIPNGVYIVTGIVNVAINEGPCSDFMINVPYPEPSQYQDIEWLERPPMKLLKTYRESGDRRFFFTQRNCSKVPSIKRIFKVRFYKIKADFSKIGKIHPYKTSSRLYKDNIRPKEVHENLKIPWIKQSVISLKLDSAGNPLDYARLAYAHVVTNFTYGIPADGPESGLYRTIRDKKGDCGGLSAVYVALLRAGGVPCRMTACLRPTKEHKCHCWSEFYLEGYGWIPVDVTFDLGSFPSYKHFGYYADKTIVMTRGNNFEVTSAGGKRFPMSFCQGLCYWYWNYNGQRGRPEITNLFEGSKLDEQ